MALKDRLHRLELKSRPLMALDWLRRAIEAPDSDQNLLKSLHVLCEVGVLLKPPPHVWKQYEALADLSQLSDEELLRIENEIDDATNAACWSLLIYETFHLTPAEIYAPDAEAKLDECLRGQLVTVREDAIYWSPSTIERALKDATAAMEREDDQSEKAVATFLRNYQP